MPASFGVVDLFAGPGGLGEGLASFTENGHAPYRIAISVENEKSAHRTLTLRAFLRRYRQHHGKLPIQFLEFHAAKTQEPRWEDIDSECWKAATAEARCLELGTDHAATELDNSIAEIADRFDDTILIGGPPCQAYSLVGRARIRGQRNYVPEKDHRHYLFREYIRVLERLRPAAFIMENVKGMLSSTVDSRMVFEMLMEDLSSLGTARRALYEVRAVKLDGTVARLCEAEQPSDYVVRSESFGVPQRRHRVIIIGLRSDLAGRSGTASIHLPQESTTVADAIGNLPRLRSGLSRGWDSPENWKAELQRAARDLSRSYRSGRPLGGKFREIAQELRSCATLERSAKTLPDGYGHSNSGLLMSLESAELHGIAHHETRGHMASDLGRYLFAAAYAQVEGTSPKADQFPSRLAPDHRNWWSGSFSDRFRVQLDNAASTTVTSHISKDGHYYIHHDPLQCRSLTVREAARLQTFPDDYLFLGNRTQQYVQVGNAVPPYLARKIAGLLLRVLEDESASGSFNGARIELTDRDNSEITSRNSSTDAICLKR